MRTIAAIIAIVSVAACSQLPKSQTVDAGARFQLVQDYRGDALIIDSELTQDDCLTALPDDQADKGLTFSCELEG